MMNLMLEGNFFVGLWDRLVALFGIYNFWLGMGIAILGVALFLLARRLTRVHRGEDTITNDDKVFLTYKILSVICVVCAVIIWIFFC